MNLMTAYVDIRHDCGVVTQSSNCHPTFTRFSLKATTFKSLR